MSYSRWGNSKWYTYWSTTTAETREEQVFEVCTVTNFTYKQLKENIDNCVQYVKDIVDSWGDQFEETDFKELKEYMQQFVKDMEEEFPPTTKERIEAGEITLEDGFLEEV